MRLGIMQPYFFPYLGYFGLIHRTDAWVVFDVVKYTPKTWANRNRILHPRGSWQYVSVPVVHRHGQRIEEAEIQGRLSARDRVLGQLDHYRHAGAPYFAEVRNLVAGSFALNSDSLCAINVQCLELVCGYLGIGFRPRILSREPLDLPVIEHPGQWALEIATALDADEYVNPSGGTKLFDPEAFRMRGIRLTFAPSMDFRYPTGPYEFVNRLSILDVLMWNAPEHVRAHLDIQAEATVSANRSRPYSKRTPQGRKPHKQKG